jgi:putative FmdB family regulatory protein
MLYDYVCAECHHEMTDVYQSIKDDALVSCPKCGQNALQRVVYGGLGAFVKDIKTIGQLADSNWNKLGHYRRSEEEETAKQKRQEQEGSSVFSAFGSASKKDIVKMTPEQQKKYIITGEK